MTKPWWTTDENSRLQWKTAVFPKACDGVRLHGCKFGDSRGTHPRSARQALFQWGARARVRDRAAARPRLEPGGFQLRYESRRSEWPWSAAHRQFSLNGDSGIYRLQCAGGEDHGGQA